MTVTSGELHVMQPGGTKWKSYKPSDTYMVVRGVSLKVKTEKDTTYLCLYR